MWPGCISFFMTTTKHTVMYMESFRLLSTIIWHYTFQTLYPIIYGPPHAFSCFSYERINGIVVAIYIPTNNRFIESEIFECYFTYVHIELPAPTPRVNNMPASPEWDYLNRWCWTTGYPFDIPTLKWDGPCQCFIHSLKKDFKCNRMLTEVMLIHCNGPLSYYSLAS